MDEALHGELRQNKPTEIENIVIEPQATSQVFVMYGSRGEEGVLFQVDFSQLHEPQCKGIERRRALLRLRAVDAHRRPRRRHQVLARPPGAVHAAAARVAVLNGEQYERVEFRKRRVRRGGLRVRLRLRALGGQRPVRRDHGDVVGAASCAAATTRCRTGTTSSPATCDPTQGVDHLPTKMRCPGMFGGSGAEVSSGGWFVLLLMLCLIGALGFVTATGRSERFSDLVGPLQHAWKTKSMPSFNFGGSSHVKYGGLGQAPDSAADDELDLGEYDERPRSSATRTRWRSRGAPGTLPVRTMMPDSGAEARSRRRAAPAGGRARRGVRRRTLAQEGD